AKRAHPRRARARRRGRRRGARRLGDAPEGLRALVAAGREPPGAARGREPLPAPPDPAPRRALPLRRDARRLRAAAGGRPPRPRRRPPLRVAALRLLDERVVVVSGAGPGLGRE